MARAAGNLVGNCVATVVVASWENDLDRPRAIAMLNGSVSTEAVLDLPESGEGLSDAWLDGPIGARAA
jgi:aerobic C4-dicarboxylate transport protein